MVVQNPSAAASNVTMDENWQQAIQGLVAANPSLKLPEQFATMLTGAKREESKKMLYDQQKVLNMKRKASLKLERMQQALQRKRFQMEAYREQLRQQLHAETQRFASETKALEADIVTQKEIVERLEQGIVKEEDENMELFVDVQEQPSLSTLLGLTDEQETDNKIAQLQREKQEAMMSAQKLQEKLQMMMATGPMPHLGAFANAVSPQMPLNERKRQKTEEGVEVIAESPKGLNGDTGMD